MYDSIDGTSFQTRWRCKLHNSILRSNGRNTLRRNIRLIKDSPQKLGGSNRSAGELIKILEDVPDENAWMVAKAMAGLSIDKALETLSRMEL